MPKSNEWQFKAATSKTVNLPSYAYDSSSRKQFVVNECKYHWFLPEEAQRLADRLELIIEDKHRPDKMNDKQLIWIVEAAKQRQIEFL